MEVKPGSGLELPVSGTVETGPRLLLCHGCTPNCCSTVCIQVVDTWVRSRVSSIRQGVCGWGFDQGGLKIEVFYKNSVGGLILGNSNPRSMGESHASFSFVI